jgi:hypothetical protein
MTAAIESQNPRGSRGWVALLAAFFGLSTGLFAIFALIVTVAEGWREHAQAQWPETTAQVKRCGLDIYTHYRETYWINCSVSYTVRGEEVVSQVHSLTTPAPRRVIWQYPPGQFDKMQDWVDEHPEGTPIRVHYDPANHAKAVLVETDMPRGGPQTLNNLKLFEFFALSCVVLLTIARIARPRRDRIT